MHKRRKLHQHIDVTTAVQCRIGIFQPTRRPLHRRGEVESSYGRAVVEGRLGQQHRDFIECCRLPYVAVAQGLDGADRYCCIVDPNKLRTAMSGSKRSSKGKPSRIGWQQLKDIAEDLRRCEVSGLEIFSRPGYGVVTAGILDAVMFSNVGRVEGHTGKGNARGTRELWKIPFSEAWTALIGNDLPVSYGGHLPRIVGLRHGVSQALARFMLSHCQGAGYGYTKALMAIGAGGRLRDRLTEVIDDQTELAAMGIFIDPVEEMFITGDYIPGGREQVSGGRDHIPGDCEHIPGSIGLIGR